MGAKLTQNDVRKIEEEIEHRKVVLRPELIEEVKETRAQGDLSENFEYHEAKRAKNRNESRIRYLERILKNATIISDESKDDEVGIDNTIVLYFEDDDEEETIKLVTEMRGDTLNDKITIDSPIGRAILGHKVGDRVEVKVDDRLSYYGVVREIINTKDDESDTIRRY